jgi:hypothetical protein
MRILFLRHHLIQFISMSNRTKLKQRLHERSKEIEWGYSRHPKCPRDEYKATHSADIS